MITISNQHQTLVQLNSLCCPVWEKVHTSEEDQHCSQHLLPPDHRMPICPTPIQITYILAGIAPPDIRRRVASMKERKRQVGDARHPLFNHALAAHRLHVASRESFLKSVEPLPTPTLYENHYVGGKVVDRSLASFTSGTQPLWRASAWSRAYVDGMEMPQQTEDWHRGLQGTPPQMGILAGQPRSKLWLWFWAPYHAAFTPVSFVGASMHSWRPRSLHVHV